MLQQQFLITKQGNSLWNSTET